VTGAVVGAGEVEGAEYWVRQVREPVRYAAAVATMREVAGEGLWVEVGPHPVLTGLGQEWLAGGEWVPTLRRGRDDWEQMLTSLATLHVRGVSVDWTGFEGGVARRKISLPTYPWQREKHWVESARQEETAGCRQVEPESGWAATVSAGRTQAAHAPLDLELSSYPVKWRVLERLSTVYIVKALRDLEVFSTAGETRTVAGLLSERGISPSYRHLILRWLRRLASAGFLRAGADGTFVAPEALRECRLGPALGEARAVLRDTPQVLEYVERCGTQLAEILTGKTSPLETLFPGGSFDVAEALYQDWALSRYFSAIVRAVVVASLDAASDRHPLRVLEVGAGTGGTTAAVLPALPPDRVIYWFTDVSTAFLSHAERKWASCGFLRFGILDMEQAPADQGFPLQAFDIVIATNVIHATRDSGATLERVRSMLAPGGLLVLCEATAHLPWFDVTTGLIEGWQRFEDASRGDSPLVDAPAWIEMLHRAGFDAVESLPESGSPAEILGQHVLIARTPAEHLRREATDSRVPEVTARAVGGPTPTPAQAVETARRLAEALPADRVPLAVEFVASQVAAVLRVARADSLDSRQPLMDLGLDSLMAVELRSRLALGLGLSRGLPATLVFEHPTIEAIARLLVTMVTQPGGVSANGSAEASVTTSSGVAAEIAHLSEEEVAALLMKKLESL
jgi:SAM-dependent methyltransferase/aryl carrier-like protein